MGSHSYRDNCWPGTDMCWPAHTSRLAGAYRTGYCEGYRSGICGGPRGPGPPSQTVSRTAFGHLLLKGLIKHYLLFVSSMFEFILVQKIINNTVEELFTIPGMSTKHNTYLRFNPIVESDIGLLLEFDRYSSD